MKFLVMGLFALLQVPVGVQAIHADPQEDRVLLTMPPVFAAHQSTKMCTNKNLEFCVSETLCESANGYWYNDECNLTSKLMNRLRTEQLAGQWCHGGTTYYFLDIHTVIEDIDNPGRYIISGGGIWGGECTYKDNPYVYYSDYSRFKAVTGWYDSKKNKWFVLDKTEYPHCIKTFRLDEVTRNQLKGCAESAGYFCSGPCLETSMQHISPP